ncbi:adhesion G-protein coupled receptor G6 [Octopus bimaculoides]|nr:adhesion G-protein coupled receptor G6 [Octopus bimaculoides]
MASPKCLPFTGIWQKPDISQCYDMTITQQLKNIINEGIDIGNIEEKSKELVNISQKSVYFKEEDINFAVDIQEKMVPLISNVSTNIVLNYILLGINNMINVPETVLVQAEHANKTVNRMLDIIEAITEKISLEEPQVRTLYSNLGIGVTKVENGTFDGVFYGILDGNNETEAKNMIYNSMQPQQVDTTVNFISLPKSLLKHLKADEQSSISRISFSSMHDKLYRVIRSSSTKEIAKINSYIIAANIPNIESITNLDEPVAMSFNLIIQNATNPRCVYWDESPGQEPKWSSKGCDVFRYVPGKKVVCSCNHLTSFALLMDIYETNITNPFLSMISYIGCGISAVFLILTILIHVCFKKLRKLMTSKILVNLCSSLAVTNLIFLVGTHPYATDITAVCKAVAVVLHYFLMTSIMWTTIEALHVFLAVVVVFKVFEKSFMRRSLILAWGMYNVFIFCIYV